MWVLEIGVFPIAVPVVSQILFRLVARPAVFLRNKKDYASMSSSADGVIPPIRQCSAHTVSAVPPQEDPPNGPLGESSCGGTAASYVTRGLFRRLERVRRDWTQTPKIADETSLEPLSVSGGTASFFRVVGGRFVAKDLKHARAEAVFYDRLRKEVASSVVRIVRGGGARRGRGGTSSGGDKRGSAGRGGRRGPPRRAGARRPRRSVREQPSGSAELRETVLQNARRALFWDEFFCCCPGAVAVAFRNDGRKPSSGSFQELVHEDSGPGRRSIASSNSSGGSRMSLCQTVGRDDENVFGGLKEPRPVVPPGGGPPQQHQRAVIPPLLVLPHAGAAPQQGGPAQQGGRAGSGSSFSSEVREFLVLKNMYAGFEDLRFVDLKIGFQTAVAGWMGKSAFRAWKNHQLDRVTNSGVEGFRAEGMENAPPLFRDFVHVARSHRPLATLFLSARKLGRIALQRLSGCELLRIFLEYPRWVLVPAGAHDAHRRGTGIEEDRPWTTIRTSFRRRELYARYVLLVILVKLTKLVQNLAQLDAPQMWIGSSIGIGFDASPFEEERSTRPRSHTPPQTPEDLLDRGDYTPPTSSRNPSPQTDDDNGYHRPSGEKGLSDNLHFPSPPPPAQHPSLPAKQDHEPPGEPFVRVFDWGRSEFNTTEAHAGLSPTERALRVEHWRSYLQGVLRLLYQASRVFLHRFACPAWRSVVLEIQEFHSMHENVVLGGVEIPLFCDGATTTPAGGPSTMSSSCDERGRGQEDYSCSMNSSILGDAYGGGAAAGGIVESGGAANVENGGRMPPLTPSRKYGSIRGTSAALHGFLIGHEYLVPVRREPSRWAPAPRKEEGAFSSTISGNEIADIVGYISVVFRRIDSDRISLEVGGFRTRDRKFGSSGHFVIGCIAFETARDAQAHLGNVLTSGEGSFYSTSFRGRVARHVSELLTLIPGAKQEDLLVREESRKYTIPKNSTTVYSGSSCFISSHSAPVDSVPEDLVVDKGRSNTQYSVCNGARTPATSAVSSSSRRAPSNNQRDLVYGFRRRRLAPRRSQSSAGGPGPALSGTKAVSNPAYVMHNNDNSPLPRRSRSAAGIVGPLTGSCSGTTFFRTIDRLRFEFLAFPRGAEDLVTALNLPPEILNVTARKRTSPLTKIFPPML